MVIEKVELGPGDTHCPECGGNGVSMIYLYHFDKNNEIVQDGSHQIITCRYCDGIGKFDWIQNITRKISNNEYMIEHNKKCQKAGLVQFGYRQLTEKEQNKYKKFF